MPRPQFSLKALLWLMGCVACFAAIVSAAPEKDRIFVAIGLLWAISPLAAGIALAINSGQSKLLTIAGWTVVVGSVAAAVALFVLAIVQS